MNLKSSLLILMTIAALLIVGCEKESHTGAGIGALIGGGVGQVAGGDTESTLIGAAVGAGAGYLIGRTQEGKDDDEVDQDQVQQVKTQPQEVTENPEDFVKVPYTNSDGTVTTVALRKSNRGYRGPEGEYYDDLPTKKVLKDRYGY